jgi:MoxR-like ATPase
MRRGRLSRPGAGTGLFSHVRGCGTMSASRGAGQALMYVTVEPTVQPQADDEANPAASTEAAPRGASSGRLWPSLREATAHAVVGGESALRLLTVALLADGHALVEDVPGIGKTLLARAFARALGLQSGRIQGTPDLLPVDVTGSSVLEGGTLRFVPGPVFTNVLLVDEINRATPRTQSALLEAMQERQVSIEGVTRPLPDPFLLLATQNPVEFEGTFALPEAEVDRFLVRVRIGYPDEEQERRIARRYQDARDPLASVPAVLDADSVIALRDQVRRIRVASEIEAYVAALTRATRAHPDVALGASPRATVALYRCAQAWAFLEGRAFVLPDDVKAVTPFVLTHRLVVDLDRSMRGVTADEVVRTVLSTVGAPPDIS